MSRRPFFFAPSLASKRTDGLSGPVTSQATSELDPATMAAIRDALAAAQRGRIADACATAEQALANGGDVTALNAMLGMLRGKAGDAAGAIRHLELAHRERPGDLRIAGNLASALAVIGDFKRAMAVASADRAKADLQIAKLRGYAAQMVEEPAAARDAYEQVVAAAPDDWESWNNLGNARLALDDVDGGIDALRRSAEINPEAAPTRLNLARAYRKAGDVAEAERQLRAMAEHFTDDSMSLIDLHDLLLDQGRPDQEIMAVLRQATDRDPNNPKLLLAAARQLALLVEIEESGEFFRRALVHDPASSEAYIGLVNVYEYSRPDDLKELLTEAERAGVDPDTVNLLRAFALRRAKRNAEGLAVIEQLPEGFESARREELTGQFHERMGDFDAAFAAFTRMNEAQAANRSQPLERAAKHRAQVRDRMERMTADWVSSWHRPVRSKRPAPTFLVGFPRSGTTLLDTMFMGHPDVAVMEERPVVATVGSAFGGFSRIPELDEAEIRKAQDHYFEEASRYVSLVDAAHLIDKAPLHLNNVPIIHRLFPDARFILALRHPADSVLSCFVSNFRTNSSMSNFLQLDTAAEFYDLTFSNWEKCTALLPIEVHSVAYESLVADPEPELRRLSNALGLAWKGEMLDHTRTAAERGVIKTASYAQVTEPIYRSSVGRWQNYRRHLEPILPVLAPWAEKFGYTL